MWPFIAALLKAAATTAVSKGVANAMTPSATPQPGETPALTPMNLEALLQKRDASEQLPKLKLQQY